MIFLVIFTFLSGSFFLFNWHNTVPSNLLLLFLHFEQLFPLYIPFLLPLILIQLQENALDKVSIPHVRIYLIDLHHAHRHVLFVPRHLQFVLTMHRIGDRFLFNFPDFGIYPTCVYLFHRELIVAQFFTKYRHGQQNVWICLRFLLNQLLLSLTERILDF